MIFQQPVASGWFYSPVAIFKCEASLLKPRFLLNEIHKVIRVGKIYVE